MAHHYPLWMQVAPGAAGDALPADAADELRADLGAHLGTTVGFAEAPHRLDTSFGPFAIGCRLAPADGLPPGWGASLVLRAEGAAAEAEVLSCADDLPCHVPGLVAADVKVSPDLGGTVLVSTWPPGTDFVEIIGTDPDAARGLFRRLSGTLAALHEVDASLFGPALTEVDLDVELADLGPGFEVEVDWLQRHAPAADSRSPVLCHGGLTPLVASLSDPDAERFTLRNWSAAVRADPEYDLAWSLLSFWIAPFFANTRSERRGMIMIRDGLANLFRTGYEAERSFDPARVRYWEAFHAARGAARSLADPGSMPDDVAPNLRKRFAKLTRR